MRSVILYDSKLLVESLTRVPVDCRRSEVVCDQMESYSKTEIAFAVAQVEQRKYHVTCVEGCCLIRSRERVA